MPGNIPASKIPRMNLTPQAADRLWTYAVPIDAIPKPSVVNGMNQPGPMNLQSMFAGISKIM